MGPPPGIPYLRRTLPHLLLPSTLVYVFLYTIPRYINNTEIMSYWVIVTLAILARPFLFFLHRWTKNFRDARVARSLGAVLVPQARETGISAMRCSIQSLDEYPGDEFDLWRRKYGNITQIPTLTDPVIMTLEPDHLKAILVTESDNFEKGSLFCSQMSSFLGVGIFNVDGEMWKFHRSMTRPFFSRERISDFNTFDRNTTQALDLIRARLPSNHPIDFQDLLSRFSLDSSTEFLFGSNIGSLDAGIPYPPGFKFDHPTDDQLRKMELFNGHPSNAFANAFKEGMTSSAFRVLLGTEWPLAELWKDKVKPWREVIDRFLDPLVDVAMESAAKQAAGGDEGGARSLLGYLVTQTQDRTMVKDELVNLFLAGRDSTTAMVSFGTFMLCRHPHIERRLREEILNVVGPTGRPTYGHIQEMKYLRAFLSEVLRLYPPVPNNTRMSKKATVLRSKSPDTPDYYIPANTQIMFSVLVMHRRTDLWGPDALTFDPDRFLDARLQKYLVPNPHIFMPFQAGPRVCLGQQFAYQEASYFLVRLLQSFTGFALAEEVNTPIPENWKAEGEQNPIKSRDEVRAAAHLTLYIKDGLWMKMRELRDEDLVG